MPKGILSAGTQLSFDDVRRRTGRGGLRAGAGRKRNARARVPHRLRPAFSRTLPGHVTLRVRGGLPSLRCRRLVREWQRSLRIGCEREEFRVLHYSLQRDHAHLIVEAEGSEALARGMRSIGARLARAVNRVFARSGPVLDGRYHVRLLRTPREVRNALAYVLLNARRHWMKRFGVAPPLQIDAASSGRWFTGWLNGRFGFDACGEPDVARARTWLAREGWRRHGLVDPEGVPGI